MRRRSEDMLIASVLLVSSLFALALFFLFTTAAIVGVMAAWGRWGW